MSLRVMTYNIRAGLGLDGRRRLDRIARVIDETGVDIVALQEVDLRRKRSEGVDQPEMLGELTGMHVTHGHSFADDDGGKYGNAVLTSSPSSMVRHANLPGKPGREPRSVMRVEVAVGTGRVTLVNTHFGLTRPEHAAQAACLVEDGWLEANGDEPLVLCGDFNFGAWSRSCKLLRGELRDAFAGTRWPAFNTWPTRVAVRRLDHVMYTGPLEVVWRGAVKTKASRGASDHYPLVVRFERRGGGS